MKSRGETSGMVGSGDGVSRALERVGILGGEGKLSSWNSIPELVAPVSAALVFPALRPCLVGLLCLEGVARGGRSVRGRSGRFPSLSCAAVIREDRLSKWNGSVGVLSSVSTLRADSADILRSFSILSSCLNRCSLSGVNISSTSVLKIFPLNMSTTFEVTSVKVHRAGVLAGGGGT